MNPLGFLFRLFWVCFKGAALCIIALLVFLGASMASGGAVLFAGIFIIPAFLIWFTFWWLIPQVRQAWQASQY